MQALINTSYDVLVTLDHITRNALSTPPFYFDHDKGHRIMKVSAIKNREDVPSTGEHNTNTHHDNRQSQDFQDYDYDDTDFLTQSPTNDTGQA